MSIFEGTRTARLVISVIIVMALVAVASVTPAPVLAGVPDCAAERHAFAMHDTTMMQSGKIDAHHAEKGCCGLVCMPGLLAEPLTPRLPRPTPRVIAVLEVQPLSGLGPSAPRRPPRS